MIHHIMHDSYFAECNDAIARMYGFTTGEDLVGKRLTEMLVPDDAREYRADSRIYTLRIQGYRSRITRIGHSWPAQGVSQQHDRDCGGRVFGPHLGDSARCDGASEARRSPAVRLRQHCNRAKPIFGFWWSKHQTAFLLRMRRENTLTLIRPERRCWDIRERKYCDSRLTTLLPPTMHFALPSEVNRFAGGATVLSEWKFRRKDGSVFPGEVCGKQLPDGRLQGILRDISERRQAEEPMRRNEERFRVALKDSPITVFSQDQELRYTWIYNPQLYWEHDAIGKTDEQLIGTKRAARLMELKRRVLKNRNRVTG